MTVDAEGYVWSARWDGSFLCRYTPQGVEERRVAFPAKKVSSAIFAGDDLTDIYVTTAGGQDKAEEGPGARRPVPAQPRDSRGTRVPVAGPPVVGAPCPMLE